MARLDLNARRAARSEAENEPHEVALGFDVDGAERMYRFVPRLPLEFTDLVSAGRLGEAMQLLLVDQADWEQLRKDVPDDDDLAAIAELYAVNIPQSVGSAPSSMNGSRASKPTSRRTTGSTSRRPVGGPGPSGSGGSTP